MVEVNISLPENPTRADIEAYVEAKWQALSERAAVAASVTSEEVDARIAAATQDVIKYGDNIALEAQMGNGMVLCAEEGGPTEHGEPFVLTAREAVGPHESWKIHRGLT